MAQTVTPDCEGDLKMPCEKLFSKRAPAVRTMRVAIL